MKYLDLFQLKKKSNKPPTKSSEKLWMIKIKFRAAQFVTEFFLIALL